MSVTPCTALVTQADHVWGRWAAEALLARGDRVIATGASADFDLPGAEPRQMLPTDDRQVSDLFANIVPALDIVVIGTAPRPAMALEAIAPAMFLPMAEAGIAAPWLALKYMLAHATAGREPIIVLLDPSADATLSAYPLHDAEGAALRHMVAATLLDALQSGLRPRSNRLVFSQTTDEQAFKEAILVLTDQRSRFMTGSEIVLGA